MNPLVGALFLLLTIFMFWMERRQLELIQENPLNSADEEILFAIALVRAFVIFVILKLAGWL